MKNNINYHPTIERDGWALVSAEEKHLAHPDAFLIPSKEKREALLPGDSAKLLFDIAITENGILIDRGIDRMWVIIKAQAEGIYIGVLDNDPGVADGLNLHVGDTVIFGPEHVADIDKPPIEYIFEKYGPSFFE